MKIDFATIGELLTLGLNLLLGLLGFVSNIDQNKAQELVSIGKELVEVVSNEAAELQK